MLLSISSSITLTSGPLPVALAITHSRKTPAAAIGSRQRRAPLLLTSITCPIGHSLPWGFLEPPTTRNTVGGISVAWLPVLEACLVPFGSGRRSSPCLGRYLTFAQLSDAFSFVKTCHGDTQESNRTTPCPIRTLEYRLAASDRGHWVAR